jgi:hypothetical protein
VAPRTTTSGLSNSRFVRCIMMGSTSSRTVPVPADATFSADLLHRGLTPM